MIDLGDAEDARGLAQLVGADAAEVAVRHERRIADDPVSPRDAHSRTTRAPASARRASVPPHASDSSSGCAKTASTVRPARRQRRRIRRSVSVGHDAASTSRRVDGDVLVDHAVDAEARDRALADAPAIEAEHARQPVDHLLEVVEHDAGDALVDDLADRAAIERGDRRAAGHRFGQHEAERLARLDRVEERPRAAVQLHLGREVGLADVDDLRAVDVRRDVLAVVVVLRRRPGSAACRRAWRPRSPAARPCLR